MGEREREKERKKERKKSEKEPILTTVPICSTICCVVSIDWAPWATSITRANPTIYPRPTRIHPKEMRKQNKKRLSSSFFSFSELTSKTLSISFSCSLILWCVLWRKKKKKKEEGEGEKKVQK